MRLILRTGITGPHEVSIIIEVVSSGRTQIEEIQTMKQALPLLADWAKMNLSRRAKTSYDLRQDCITGGRV